MVRAIIISDEVVEFIDSNSKRVSTKFKYLLTILREQQIVHKSIVEKLVDTDFYELKIKAENQIRVIIFTLDHQNFNQAKEIILLNGFLKRSNKDYVKAIKISQKILIRHGKEEE